MAINTRQVAANRRTSLATWPAGLYPQFPCAAQCKGGDRLKHLGKTRPFRGPDGRVVRGSIAEVNYLRLGGVDQWVLIRGESLTNPPLLLLHGGPGFSERHFFRRFNAPLEKIFTVV